MMQSSVLHEGSALDGDSGAWRRFLIGMAEALGALDLLIDGIDRFVLFFAFLALVSHSFQFLVRIAFGFI